MNTRVLVVDDTVVFRRIISDALAALPGVEVVGTASNGKLALARLASLQPDLLTLDIEMPEMNGIEVLEALVAAGSKAGVIMVSSNTVRGGQITVRALELGAFDFITKPEGGSPEDNLVVLRASLLPVIRAFERRREIRSILGNKPFAEQASPGCGASREIGAAVRIRDPFDRRLDRRTERACGSSSRPAAKAGRTPVHRAAHASLVHPGTRGTVAVKERDPRERGRSW